MELIQLDSVDFAYGGTTVLRSLSLMAHEQEVTVLVGPSGSGKSTVLRLIAGFEAPQRGRVILDGDVVAERGRIVRTPETRGVSVVFQDLALWPHMTVRETLEFVLGPDIGREERRRRVDEASTIVGLQRHIDTRPAHLSGGERQRLALARAVITRPRILLMDEPLANLDPPLRLALLEEVRSLRQRLGLTIVYVTHNQAETFVLGHQAAVLHDGRIAQAAPPRELYEHPASAFVASFLGRCALLPGQVTGGHALTALGAFATAAAEGERVAVVIRPEDVVVDDDGPLTGRVAGATSIGPTFEVELTDADWRVWATMRQEPKPGAVVRFSLARFATVPLQDA
jgi:ABC-type Fe3+/spermidine/putrescine transport system ATPase subunit